MNTSVKLFRHWIIRYGFSVILVALATWLFQQLSVFTGTRPPLFIWYYPATIIAAIAGGFGPGLVATLLSAASVTYFFISPLSRLTIDNEADALGVAVFSLMGLSISLLMRVVDRPRQQSEAELHRVNVYNRSLLETSLDPLVTISPEGKVTDVNAATEAVTGCSRDELIGTEFADYFADPMKARAGYQEVFRAGAVRDYALDIRHSDGHLTPVLYNAAVYRDETGKVAGVFAAARDITERKQAEDEVRKLTTELEQRVVERTAQLETSNHELEAFSYSVSHDLRTPLRAIDGFSRMIEKNYAGQLDAEGARLIRVVRDNTARMSQLIDDILAFSRAGRLEIRKSEINLAELANNVWQELEPSRTDRDVRLDIKPLQPALGDLTMLRQVMDNLLGNAIKFTRTQAIARIEIGNRIEGLESVYYVKDNGVGFDPQYVHKLFGVFQRLHDITEFEGTGIGLAIAKRIIARHGGRIWAEGRVNEGATVYFTLPRKEN